MLRILHVSDPHFGARHHFRQTEHDPARSSLGEAISDAVGDSPPDWVVISGDIFTKGNAADYLLVADALRDFMSTLKIPMQRLLCVPGNHDVTWDAQYDRFRLYDGLVTELGLRDPAHELLPQVIVISEEASTPPVALLMLDSCRVENERMAGIGRLGDDQRRKLKNRLDESNVSGDSHILLAMMHHHLLPISPVEMIVDPLNPRGGPIGKSSVTVDAVETLRQLAELGVTAVLHGHQHRPAILRHQNRFSATPEIHIFAAGTCGAKPEIGEDVLRQFFVYAIQALSLEVWSYEQSRHNASMFARSPSPWRIDVMRGRPDGLVSCEEDRRVRSAQAAVVESGKTDNSDLYFLLMSVVECPRSRAIIRELVERLPTSPQWKELGGRYLKLSAMYDLLGRWDLMVRFRLDPRVNVQQFRRLLDGELTRQGMLPPTSKRHTTLFGLLDLVDVQQEAKSLGTMALDGRVPASDIEISRVRLATTDEYDRARCQRAFVYIELPKDRRDDALIHDVRTALDRDRESSQIVESVCRSETALILELFMTCAQSSHINRLNRTIESVLTRYTAQKYTLLCYGYDEEPLNIETG